MNSLFEKPPTISPAPTPRPTRPCQTAGCSRSTVYGGLCTACAVLFGSYDQLVALDDVEEWKDTDGRPAAE